MGAQSEAVPPPTSRTRKRRYPWENRAALRLIVELRGHMVSTLNKFFPRARAGFTREVCEAQDHAIEMAVRVENGEF